MIVASSRGGQLAPRPDTRNEPPATTLGARYDSSCRQHLGQAPPSQTWSFSPLLAWLLRPDLAVVRRQSEVHGCQPCQALSLVLLVLQEEERQVDTFEFAEPAFGFGLSAPGEEVGVDLLQPLAHGRVDVQHWAADKQACSCSQGVP